MSLEKEIQKISGGFHTTSSMGGKILLDRLIDGGCVFSMKVLKGKNEWEVK